MPLLQAKDLSYGVPGGRLLQRRLDFRLEPGEVLLISGANGCGKSTLLKIILGEHTAVEGSLDCAVTGERVDYLPQLENTEVHLPLTLSDVISLSQARHVTWQEVAPFGLLDPHHLMLSWNSASGGERKRALLTCSLLNDPQLLVFDEPLNHLDDASRSAVTTAINQFVGRSTAQTPRGVVMVCHQGLTVSEGERMKLIPLVLERLA